MSIIEGSIKFYQPKRTRHLLTVKWKINAGYLVMAPRN